MGLLRGASLAVVVGSLGVWLASAVSTSAPTDPEPRPTPAAPRDEPKFFDFEQQQLRLRSLASNHSSEPGRRDLFRFGRRSVSDNATQPPVAPQVAPPAPPPGDAHAVAIDGPCPLTLIGIAERQAPDGVQRVAVLSGFNQVFLVSAGELVTSRCEVADVSSEAAEIIERPAGRSTRLSLSR